MFRVIRTFRSFTNFSTKRTERIQKKMAEAEQVIGTTTNLDTVADQVQLTDHQLVGLIEERKEFIRKLQMDTVVPREAYYLAAITLGPLMVLSGMSLYCSSSPELMQYTGTLIHSALKYAAINVAFQSGIHWGFAMSQHECQLDWLNSSSEARRSFFLAIIPILGSILLAHHCIYGDYDVLKLNFGIGGLILMNIFVTLMDLRNRRHTPGWYLKSKGLYSFGFHACMVPLIVVNFRCKEVIPNIPSIYRIM